MFTNTHNRSIRRSLTTNFAIAAGLVATLTTSTFAQHDDHEHDHAGHCIDRGGVSVMFEPEIDLKEAQNIAAAHSNATVAFVPQGGTWQLTATDGSVQPGQPMTLTYSFVPDGTQIFSSYADDDTVSNLFATMDANFPGGRAAWKQVFADMFEEWSQHTNITYVEVSDDGTPWSMFNFGAPGERGDIRIAMHPIGPGPLAYNSYPNFGGDMVLDSLDINVFTNPVNGFRSLRNTLLHEHGHGLGLAHVIPQNGTKLMEPVLNTGFDGPQEDDVRAAQFLYGDSFEPNDGPLDAPFLGGSIGNPDDFGVQEFVVEGVALEGADSSDWYAFTAFGGSRFAARLEPVGTTYDFGPQNGSFESVDASAARDLSLRIYRRVSSQTGEVQMINQIDFNEAGEAENLPMLLYTIAGMMYAEVYSTDGIDDVQAYRLIISNVAIEEPVDPPSMSVADGIVPVQSGDTFFVDPAEVGQSSSVALTIRNNGSGPLRFEGTPRVIIEGVGATDFSADLAATELPAGGFAVLGLTFTPTQPGERVAVVRIPNNDPNAGDYSFIIRGTAEASVIEEPDLLVLDQTQTIADGSTIALADTTIGDVASLALTLRNVGLAALQFDADAPIMDGPGADAFVVSLQTSSIQPDGFAVLGISFEPTEPGEHFAEVRLPSNDPDEGDFSFVLTAVAVAQAEALIEVAWEQQTVDAGDLLDFGDVEVGQTLNTELAITNTGDADLVVSSIQITGEAAADYSNLSGASGTIPPGQTGTATLSVTPSAAGPRNATLNIVSNSATGSFSLGLTTNGFENVQIIDCNGNGIDDAEDLQTGSDDCNNNSIPDECETDSDGDDVIDDCDNCPITPNPQQLDANGNGAGDACDVVEIPEDDGDEEIDDNGDENAGDEVDDEDVEEDNDDIVKEEIDRDNDQDQQEKDFQTPEIGGFCGAGTAAMIPLMVLGLGGMRPRRRLER